MGVGCTAVDIMLNDYDITGLCKGLLPCTASV